MATPIIPGPGMVTPNMVGSTYQNMTPQAEAYYYRELDRKREEREARNREIAAQRNAEQQGAQAAANRERVHAAFNKLYAPQLQGAYHDQMVMSEGVPGTGVPNRYGMGQAMTGGGANVQSRLASGNMKPWSEPGSYTPKGGWYTLPQEKLDRALENMWQMQTDPYTRTAGQLNMMGLMFPSRVAAMEDPGISKGGGGSVRRKITTNEQEEQPGGIDWQKRSRPGPSGYPLGERL